MFIVGSFGIIIVPSASAETLVLTVNHETVYLPGQTPSVSGKVTTQDGYSLPGVEIQVNFPSRTIMTETDSSGTFIATTPLPTEPGEYTVIVSATKDRSFVDAQFSYFVKGNISAYQAPSENNEKKEDLKLIEENVNSLDETSLEPTKEVPKQFYRELSQMPQTPEEELSELPDSNASSKSELDNISNTVVNFEQRDLGDQRNLSKENIKQDLIEMEKKNEPNTPRNVFVQFLEDIDTAVKNIFWGQFLFTEEKTNVAQDAKEQALNDGKSSIEATKIFQQKAASTRAEIIEHNEKLNIEFGNATAQIQDTFDKEGKLPRN